MSVALIRGISITGGCSHAPPLYHSRILVIMSPCPSSPSRARIHRPASHQSQPRRHPMSIAALSPDLVLTNATVVTADAKNTRAEAVAVWNGRIGAIGPARDIDALADARTKKIDLKGR